MREAAAAGELAEHVPVATGTDALSYLAVVTLWLAGVVAMVFWKLRTA